MRTLSHMETNPLISAFATAFLLVLAAPGCAASLQPTEPHVPVAYVEPAASEVESSEATKNELPSVIHARVFGERRAPSESPPVARVPFLAPDTSRAGAEPCRLVTLPEDVAPVLPPSDPSRSDAERSSAIASAPARPTSAVNAQPPSVTVTGFRGRAPVDIAWAFPVPPSRNGAPAPAAPTGKTLVQMALFDALPAPDAKPRTVLQCTSEIDSIAWAVPRAMVDELIGSAPAPGAVVRVSVARAPGKLVDAPKRPNASRFAVGAFVDLPVERDGATSVSRR